MILPNLFIPGAARSGSTTLHRYLEQHPDIFMTKAKEPNFFNIDERYYKGLKEYSKLFEFSDNYKIRGESSISYMLYPYVVERIKSSITHPKFIVIFRNPIDRAYSHYWWLRGTGYENKNFREAFLSDMYQTPDPNQQRHGRAKYYFVCGCYAKWLKYYIDGFGCSSIYILTLERMMKDAITQLNGCCEFLKVAPFEKLQPVPYNETIILRLPMIYLYLRDIFNGMKVFDPPEWGFLNSAGYVLSKLREKSLDGVKSALKVKKKYPKLNPSERGWVASFYKNEVDRLRAITGMPFDEWNADFPLEKNNL